MDSNDRQFKRLGRVFAMATTSALLLAGGNAMASCWHDPQIADLAKSIASGFPLASRRMPEVVVCDGHDFGPMIGGDFTALPNGRTVIRLPTWQTGPRGALHSSLAHELAHAEAHEQGLNEPFGGHGAGFMAALLRAGWEQEAERVARAVAGADGALAAARRGLGNQGTAGRVLPAAGLTQVVCEFVPKDYCVRMPDGTVITQRIGAMECRTVSR